MASTMRTCRRLRRYSSRRSLSMSVSFADEEHDVLERGLVEDSSGKGGAPGGGEVRGQDLEAVLRPPKTAGVRDILGPDAVAGRPDDAPGFQDLVLGGGENHASLVDECDKTSDPAEARRE